MYVGFPMSPNFDVDSIYLALNPSPMFGSYEESSLDNAHCFDRSSRFGPYEMSSNDPEPVRESESTKSQFVDWGRIDWGQLQSQCIQRNKDRFQESSAQPYATTLRYPATEEARTSRNLTANETSHQQNPPQSAHEYRDRKAFVLRAHDQIRYTPESLQHIRAMISELSLQTGGEYSVYLLVEIKQSSRHIFHDTSAYEQALIDYIPSEFRNITVLWNQAWLEAWYPKINPAGYQTQHANQPLQLFSLHNPQFAYIWEIELDVRYTGHWYNLISNAESWARTQPRKLQWERSAEFYIPWFHGSCTHFSDSIAAANPDGGIWGPIPNNVVPEPLGPRPPTQSPADDDFKWGVGEDADIIAFAPIIDTDQTPIFQKDPTAGFPENSTCRALMTTPVRRLSKDLLKIMHDGQIEQGLHQRSEMFPHNMALLHGLKVASYPIPTFVDDQASKIKDGAEANRLFNAVGQDSTFSSNADPKARKLREGISFWWRLPRISEQYSQSLYQRWYRLGGAERLCLPGMLLHPVKDVD